MRQTERCTNNVFRATQLANTLVKTQDLEPQRPRSSHELPPTNSIEANPSLVEILQDFGEMGMSRRTVREQLVQTKSTPKWAKTQAVPYALTSQANAKYHDESSIGAHSVALALGVVLVHKAKLKNQFGHRWRQRYPQ